MPQSLLPLLPHIPALLLVMFRLTGIFLFAPLFGSNLIPARVKVLLALVLSLGVYPMVPPQTPVELALPTLAVAVGSELLIGVVIGYGASLPLVALQMGGMMMGQQLGLGLAQVITGQSGTRTDVTSQFFFVVALTVFLLLDGHHQVLTVLVRSFESIPLGGYAPRESMVRLIVGLLGSMYELAVRVAAPLLCLVFLETIAMGFIARTVPQFNLLSIGFPLRILMGLALIMALLSVMNDALAAEIDHAMGLLLRYFTR